MESTSSTGSTAVIDIGATVAKHKHLMQNCPGLERQKHLEFLKSRKFRLQILGVTSCDASFDDVAQEATAFVSACYGRKNTLFSSLSDVRFHVWSVEVDKNTTASPKLQSLYRQQQNLSWKF